MNSTKTFKVSMILSAVLTLILGILFIWNPLSAGEGMAMLIGADLLVVGVIDVVQWGIAKFSDDGPSRGLFTGILKVVMGFFVMTHLGIAMDMISFLISMFILASGITGIEFSVKMHKDGTSGWVLNLVLSIIVVFGGALMLLEPFEALATTLMFIGIMLIIDAVYEFIFAFSMNDQ